MLRSSIQYRCSSEGIPGNLPRVRQKHADLFRLPIAGGILPGKRQATTLQHLQKGRLLAVLTKGKDSRNSSHHRIVFVTLVDRKLW
jgi:hypothetical protein